MQSLHAERTFVCKSSARALWPVLTDTERMNRAVGLGSIELQDLSNASAARYLATTHVGGLPMRYEERPYEWEFPSRFTVFRKMQSGPMKELEIEHILEERSDGSTDVRIHLRVLPRSALFRPLLKIIGDRTVERFQLETERVDRALHRGRSLPSVGKAHRVKKRVLSRAVEELKRSESASICSRLRDLVATGSDVDVSRIRPYALADEWEEDRTEVLQACLKAVRTGLLELRWEIVCPSCRTATDVLPSLDQLTQHGSCQLCDLGFDLDLDASVEVTFAPAEAIRKVDSGPYCIGGPARTPHVVSQAILPPKGAGHPARSSRGGRVPIVRAGR